MGSFKASLLAGLLPGGSLSKGSIQVALDVMWYRRLNSSSRSYRSMDFSKPEPFKAMLEEF